MRTVSKKARSVEAARRPATPGDAQKSKVYAWETSRKDETERNSLSLLDCESIIERACWEYARVQCPRVTVHYDDKLSYSQTANEHDAVISLQGWGEADGYGTGGMNTTTCLHEAAHHIQSIRFPRTSEHGYAFATIYFKLLVNFGSFSAGTLIGEWQHFGIRWRR